MTPLTRRRFLGLAGRGAAGAAVVASFPAVLYQDRWVRAAAAQTPPTVEATFVALVETVNDAGGEDNAAIAARWIIAEFDKALPPLPEGSPSAAVAAILDAYTLDSGHGPTFATTSDEGRLAALEAMVKDDSPDIRQVANQVIPFASFAYWSDAALGEPASPDGPRLAHWDLAGYLGPSHDRLDMFDRGGAPGFSASAHGEAG